MDSLTDPPGDPRLLKQYVCRREMAEIDRRATEVDGIPVLTLMENAGKAVAEKAGELTGGRGGVLVLCGKGNNGGDGFVCARHLAIRGIPVAVAILAAWESFDPASASGVNLQALKATKTPVEVLKDRVRLERLLEGCDVVVDALFGTGLSRAPEGIARDAIEAVNGSGKRVVAVDIPSGLDCDTGLPMGLSIRAAVTVTMGYPKIGFQSPSAREFTGEVVVAEIYRK